MSETPPFTIPAKMKKLVVMQGAASGDVKDCKLEVKEVDVPTPTSNELLVQMVAAAVNPSDYGRWASAKPDDSLGKEGCGIVVSTGGGFLTKRVKVGQKVGVVGPKNNQGSFSEYVTVSVIDGYFPLPDELPVEAAAGFFVNPYTTIAILETAKNMGSKALVHTAAASQLGQMMVKLVASGQSSGMEVINVVRRAEQVKILQDLGAKHIVNSSDEDWKATLKSKIDELECTVAFDAVAGASSGDILSALPSKGTLFVYGGLAGKCSGINPTDLIYKSKQVKGFLLPNWIAQGGMLMMVPRMMVAGRKANAGLDKNGWSSSQFKDIQVENLQEEVLDLLKGSATGLKLRIRFDQE